MSQKVIRNIIRFIGIFLLQVLILKRIDLSIGNFNYIHLMVYPLAVLMLPLNTPKAGALIIAFVYGLALDGFYNSPGVHAAALVFTTYMRTFILRIIEPFDGYTNKDSPTLMNMGLNWFLTYLVIMYALHMFFYFSVEAFSFVFISDILMNSIFTLIPSLGISFLVHAIFRPKY